MSSRQTRRSVSFNIALYRAIGEQAAADGVTISEWLTQIARRELERKGRPFNVKLWHMSRAQVATALNRRCKEG